MMSAVQRTPEDATVHHTGALLQHCPTTTFSTRLHNTLSTTLEPIEFKQEVGLNFRLMFAATWL